MNSNRNKVTDLANYECSGCSLCVSVCPKNCISMQEDKDGFLKPIIDNETCIDCGLCLKKCIIASPCENKKPLETFAAVSSDRDLIVKSSSGGIFAAIAERLADEGWYISGCILDDDLYPRHILTSSTEKIKKMYGSKYVQSETADIYEQVADCLKEDKKVLFSGTPCQVAAILRYTNYHINLCTIEVICHGVANNQMFSSYLDMYKRTEIQEFYFRDKGQGWTFNNKIVYKNRKEKKINHRLSSYMTYFLEGETYRDSCYSCPYAKPDRCADITIGDFWGVVGRRPDLKKEIDVEKGVSCLIVNTLKGKDVIDSCNIDKYEVAYEDIKEGNGPLNNPSSHSNKREQILRNWNRSHNWQDVDNYWKRNDYKFSYLLWSLLPVGLQHKIRLLLGKR